MTDNEVTRDEANGLWKQMDMFRDGLQSVGDKLETVRLDQRSIHSLLRVCVCLAALPCVVVFAIGVVVLVTQTAVFLQHPGVTAMLAMVVP